MGVELNQLVKDLQDFIISEDLLLSTDKVLVAVSGGVDSMVLAHLLKELGYNLGLAHVNFQLRGASADLDQKLVEETALEWQVPVHFQKFDTRSSAKDRGISIQMAARELRYPWFEQLRESNGYQKIATAHHLNDVLETLLLHLTKGTGLTGLHGILPKRESLIRPLVFASKEQIIHYANDNGLKWREDLSNDDDHYQRNLIRNQVVPLLKKINPSLEGAAKNTVEILRSVEKQYRKSIDQLRREWFTVDGEHLRVLKSSLRGIEAPVFTDLLYEFGFNYEQCKSILNETLEHTGSIFHSASHTLNVDRDEIIISPVKKDHVEETIEKDSRGLINIGGQHWRLSEHEIEQYVIKSEAQTGAFDLDCLLFPLKVRNWLPGDRFIPLGMDYPKKLSDFLIDTKVPLNYKANILVLVSGEDIVWVVGNRIDDRYKVTEETRKVLEIQIQHRTPNTQQEMMK